MTSLDRLKGTPYLIDGFESLLQAWFAPATPNPEPYLWEGDEEVEKLFQSLPDSVRQFYEVAHRWPQAKMVGGNQDWLNFPPTPETRRRWDRQLRRWVEGHELPRICLVTENQGNWVVEISTAPGDLGRLYMDEDNSGQAPTSLGYSMEVPVDEFLVTFGMQELVLSSTEEAETWEAPEEEDGGEGATLVYSGRYHADRVYLFKYHPQGYLYFGMEDVPDDWFRIPKPQAP